MSNEEAEPRPEIGTDAWWAQVQEQSRQTKRAAAQRLKDAAPALASLGVTHIIWAYDGYGDSGEMTDTTVTGNGNAPESLEDLKLSFKGFDPETQAKLDWGKLEEAVWQLMPDGFENNSGGFGEIDLDTVNSRIQVRHNQRIEETEYEEENY